MPHVHWRRLVSDFMTFQTWGHLLSVMAGVAGDSGAGPCERDNFAAVERIGMDRKTGGSGSVTRPSRKLESGRGEGGGQKTGSVSLWSSLGKPRSSLSGRDPKLKNRNRNRNSRATLRGVECLCCSRSAEDRG